jgi:hypothetical protein
MQTYKPEAQAKERYQGAITMPIEPGSTPMREPLAYFLTWTTYGAWLPGDERGWFTKPGQFHPPDEKRRRKAQALMTESALTLDPEQRIAIEATIAQHCRIRGWHLHVVNARTQHVHVVVTAPGLQPDDVMDQFKAWCTRKLKELKRVRHPAKGVIRQNWWTQRGSKRWLNNHMSLEESITYVRDLQGDPTPHHGDARIQA